MWVDRDGEKREDIECCFDCFPQFRDDFDILINEGIIRHIDFDQYKWTKSATSLALYFIKLASKNVSCVPGGFWTPVEKVFKVNRRTLSQSTSRYIAPSTELPVPKEPWEFKDIKELVLRHRENIKQQAEQERKDRETFTAIKTLIDETDDQDIEKIRAALEEIKKITA